MFPARAASAMPKNSCRRTSVLISSLVAGFAAAGVLAEDAKIVDPSKFTLKPLPLPGASGLVSLDYFAYDPHSQRFWVPASNTGRVAIIDARTDTVTSIEGFRTAAVDFRGKHPVMGPSSVALGDGVVYVGNRADSTICVISAATLKVGDCVPIGSPGGGISEAPDSLTYVPQTRELWVTRGVPPLEIPSSDRAITVLDASEPSHLKPKDKIPLDASAEGFAVDPARGRFYTSLEEQRTTIGIDLRRHSIVARWQSGCDEPHGLALDASHGILLVACNARVVAVDVAHDGRVMGSIETGAGLDNIDYLPVKRLLYAAAAEAAVLIVAHVDESGKFARVETVPTVRGARGVVVDSGGHAYVMDPLGGRILKVSLQ
jgi:DNA-binding beta-propeller fold protein YncE